MQESRPPSNRRKYRNTPSETSFMDAAIAVSDNGVPMLPDWLSAGEV
jgi:hypothetical protein